MPRVVLIDTGPVVAFLCSTERRHRWATEQLALIEAPLLTCEAVLSEADHLVSRAGSHGGLVLELLQRGVLGIGMSIAEEAAAVARIQDKYRNLSASMADACLVRMSELYDESIVMTFDTDFRVYRRHGRRAIPLLTPVE